MYQLNKPLRIVERGNDTILINVPRVELSIEVNKNVVDFFEFLGAEETISKDMVKVFAKEQNIENVGDYEELFDKLVDLEVLTVL